VTDHDDSKNRLKSCPRATLPSGDELRASGIARRRTEEKRAEAFFPLFDLLAAPRSPSQRVAPGSRLLYRRSPTTKRVDSLLRCTAARDPVRATTTAADPRCSRRRSAGGDSGTTLFRSARSDEDGGNSANIAASDSEQSNRARCASSSRKNAAWLSPSTHLPTYRQDAERNTRSAWEAMHAPSLDARQTCAAQSGSSITQLAAGAGARFARPICLLANHVMVGPGADRVRPPRRAVLCLLHQAVAPTSSTPPSC
jgi:hypothetical protein